MFQNRRQVLIGGMAAVIIGIIVVAGVTFQPPHATLSSSASTTLITQSSFSTSSSFYSTTGSVTTTFTGPRGLNFVAAVNITKGGLSGIAFDSSNGYLYATNTAAGAVFVIDTSSQKVTGEIRISNPSGIFYDQSNNEIYVTCYSGANYTAAVIDTQTNSILKYLPGSCGAGAFAYNSSRHLIFLTEQSTGILDVINDTSNTLVTRIDVGGSLYANTYDQSNGEVYVVQGNTGSVVAINGTSFRVVSTIPVQRNVSVYSLSWLAYNPIRKMVYVSTAMGNDSVFMINGTTNTIVGSFGFTYAGGNSYAYDSSRGIFFLPALSNNDTSVMAALNASDNHVLTQVRIGQDAVGSIFDPSNGDIYVIGSISTNITVFSYNS
ncbi:MAG: YncE family protein [Nitrososphaerales archaeon]